jgi:hypothetical protein
MTENTHSIHYYDASWLEKSERKWMMIRKKCINLYGYNLGKILAFIYYIFTCLILNDIKSLSKTLKIIMIREKISKNNKI